MIYFLLLDRKERYPSQEDQNLPPRNEIGVRELARGGTVTGTNSSSSVNVILSIQGSLAKGNQYITSS